MLMPHPTTYTYMVMRGSQPGLFLQFKDGHALLTHDCLVSGMQRGDDGIWHRPQTLLGSE